jgi:hypothetical protein
MQIVTAYYSIPSKNSREFYYSNIKFFFKKLKWQPVIFYTDLENYNILKEYAGKNVTFVIQPFEHSGVFQDFPESFWKDQIINDPEKYHTWQLGALWASKVYFIKQASKLVNSEWFIWVDCGSVRSDVWDLDNFTRRNTFSRPGIYLQLLNELENKDYFKYPDIFIAGSHILVHQSYIEEYIEKYKETVKIYVESNHSVISDQHIIAEMVKTCNFLKPVLYVNRGNCPDHWFFFFNAI